SVSIVGEVYLEVSKNKARPFHVNVKGMSIEVLGTHFNVRAHEEEKEIKTTLLEGSVKIHNGNSTAMLRPGQEAKVNLRASQEIRVQPADVESVTAWINGYFRFDNADIYQLMGEISRWYDVEVTFEGEIQNHEFVGQIARSSTLPEVLDILEMENVRITQEGNTLIVHP
ncbi:MAG TPA: FecR domain-containing protein, partial [Flavitalea sp.]|nr:FecR domain-containing protein [Flavitalea sp.]